jgi:hypothetical protein
MDHPSGRETWYRLTAIIPGESVPAWLHQNGVYQGIPMSDSTLVQLIAPDSKLTAAVSVTLLVEVSSPA